MHYNEDIQKGESLFNEGKIDQAEDIFKSILQNAPGDCESLNNLGVISDLRGDFKTAEEYFQKALSCKGDYLEAMINLASLYQNTKQWNEAAVQLEKYIEINNNDYNILNQLGVVFLEMAETGKAMNVIEKSLEINPIQPAVRESFNALRGINVEASEAESL